MAVITGSNKADIINTTTNPASTDAADQISAGNGDDQVRGGGGGDLIHGDAGNDRLWGDAGSDRLFGDAGDDQLNGGADDDILDGGQGNDVMTGGTGNDTFVLSKGNDVIADFSPVVTEQRLIDFEFLSPKYSLGALPYGYKGLEWNNFWACNPSSDPIYSGSGYTAVLNSGLSVGFDSFGVGASFASPAQDFDLKSGYFAAVLHNDLTVTIEAWDDGVKVGTATIVLDPVKVFVDFQARTATGADSAVFVGRFTSVDEIRINGTDAGSYEGQGTQVAMDDLLLSFTGGDVIDVPAGTNVAALVASAVGDGAGGTILKHADGTLTLQGIAPGDVSAAWFV